MLTVLIVLLVTDLAVITTIITILLIVITASILKPKRSNSNGLVRQICKFDKCRQIDYTPLPQPATFIQSAHSVRVV